MKSQSYLRFWRSNFISCESVRRTTCKSQFYLSFGEGTSFRAKGLRREPGNRNFTNSFWRSNLISCERVHRTTCKLQFYRSFWRSNLISYESVATGARKSQFYITFCRSNLISCERVAPGSKKTQFYFSFWRGRVVFRAVSLALPRAFKREIEKKERARGQESKRARENVKM